MIDFVRHSTLQLRPDASRTVIRPFGPDYPDAFKVAGKTRAQAIVDRVLSLDEDRLRAEYRGVTASLDQRHRDVEALLLRRAREIAGLTTDVAALNTGQQLLIGAYFCEEYSFEAAALFNPSMVPHPDQSGLPADTIRFVMSLRGIGEGHVSSVTFRTGTWGPDNAIHVDEPSGAAVPPRFDPDEAGGDTGVVRLHCGGARDLSETVLFPMTPSQRQGIEDMRLTRFLDEDGHARYIATYTAFSGSVARSELLLTDDFTAFEMRVMEGSAAQAKGMALFPRKIEGRYAMLGRQDSENIWLQYSDELCRWDNGARIVTPCYPWEFVQMGNCGPPIELDEGWLVLTHGVGTVRNYCVGACLLDKDDPSKVLARTPRPLIEPSERERDGYVPNVVYSCGAQVHGRTLLLPYGVADSFTSFASASVDDVLAAME